MDRSALFIGSYQILPRPLTQSWISDFENCPTAARWRSRPVWDALCAQCPRPLGCILISSNRSNAHRHNKVVSKFGARRGSPLVPVLSLLFVGINNMYPSSTGRLAATTGYVAPSPRPWNKSIWYYPIILYLRPQYELNQCCVCGVALVVCGAPECRHRRLRILHGTALSSTLFTLTTFLSCRCRSMKRQGTCGLRTTSCW